MISIILDSFHSSVALLKYGLIAIGIIDVAAPHDDATAAWRFSVCLCISNLFFFAHPQISAAFCDCSLIVEGSFAVMVYDTTTL